MATECKCDDCKNIEVNPTIELEAEVNMGSKASEYSAEAWAVGERGGVPVSEGDQTYHNNAKYYAETSGEHDSNAEAWAVGERGGEAVTSEDETYQNNARYYAELAQENQNQTAKDVEAAEQAAEAARGAVDDAQKAQAAAEQAAQEAADTVIAAQGPGILYIGEDGIPYVLDE